MPTRRNEVSYYPEIQQFIEAQLKSNFRARHRRELEVFWGIGELKTNLQRIITANPEKCACAGDLQSVQKRIEGGEGISERGLLFSGCGLRIFQRQGWDQASL